MLRSFYFIPIATLFKTSVFILEDSSLAREREVRHLSAQFQQPAQFLPPLQTQAYHTAARKASRQGINRAADANFLENGAIHGEAAAYPAYPTTPGTNPHSGTTINVNSTSQVNMPGLQQQ